MGNMEELLELTKKQLRYQKIISAFLAVIAATLLIGGGLMVRNMSGMTIAVEEAAAKIGEIDVDGINDTISSTNEMMDSVEKFSDAVDDMTSKVQDFDSWVSGLFGR